MPPRSFSLAVSPRWPGRKTGVGGDPRDNKGKQNRLDSPEETAGDAATRKRWMREKKVEVTVVGVGGEPCENTVRFGNDGVKVREALLPAPGVCWNRRPRGNLLR